MAKFEVFVNFDGNCREAMEFYAKVFKGEMGHVMTYGNAPGGAANPADKDRILYAGLPIYGITFMASDCPSDMEFVRGNSIGLVINEPKTDEVNRIFEELSVGGTVAMPLGKTFFSDLYGMVTDKYGVLWHLCLWSEG